MNNTKSPWVALLIVLTAPLLSVIDVFIINIAIPAIKKGVDATDGEVQLVIAGYLLGYATFLITGGRAGDHFGRKKVFFLGMLFFTVVSCLCGLSQTALQLNITRFFQGISASFMVPQTIAFIQVLFTDPKERAKAIGWLGITLGIASITGQVFGGYFSEIHAPVEGWRLIFFLNLPIGALALWATWKYLDETEKNASSAFDYTGVVILTVALACLIFPLIQGRESGWPLWSIMMLLLSGVILVYFVYNQRKKLESKRAPLINMELFRIKDFNIGIMAVLFHFMLHTSFLLLSAVYMQNGLGISPFNSGLYFILPGILFTVSSVSASRLIHRFGKGVLQAGVIILIVTFLLQILLMKPGVSTLWVLLLLGSYGLGNGLVLPSLLTVTLKSVPVKFAGAAAGIYSTFQQTASALGVSIIGGVFYYITGSNPSGVEYVAAFDYSLTVIIACLLVVGLMLYLLPGASTVTPVKSPAPAVAE
jgi:EmrB/QacA subfamily drug resistance transporter